MLLSLSLLIIFGLFVHYLFTKLRLPGLLGLLLLGIALGPYSLDWLSPELLSISGDLRNLSLIIILILAGMGLNKDTLKKVGGSAIRLSFIPGLIEGFTIAFLATKFLGFSFIEGGILGFIIAAVTPAVVVPQMLNLIDKKIGTKKGIPTLILAGSSIDDVFAITLFTAFLGFYGNNQNPIIAQILSIPLSIGLGIGIGILGGFLLSELFKRFQIIDTRKVLYIISIAILMTVLENWLSGHLPIASLLGVMTMGFFIKQKSPDLSVSLSKQMNNIWVLAEILLFGLIGAEVNISVALNAGLIGLAIILLGLFGRSIGVLISTLGSDLNWKERFFCVIAYTPKATVQAAIGGIPLSLGIASGEIILAIAVVSILFTAPLGAIAINKSAHFFLEIEEENRKTGPELYTNAD